ncbi:hypothetical protein ACJJTC_009002, partial [Scirpophaga incertulas]
MYNSLILVLLVVCVAAKPPSHEKETCSNGCTGNAYQCINGDCYCADGFIPNYLQTACVRCPELGESCFGTCCNSVSNISLQCWHGLCQPCYDYKEKWICRDTVEQILLISTTQVIMGTALLLGIIATFMLIFKLCTLTNVRPLGNTSNCESRLSIGSLQMYIDERLRDAPPRYSNTVPSTSAPAAAPTTTAYTNNAFLSDRLVPPPPYTEV